MVADEVGVNVFVAEVVAVTEGVGVLVKDGWRLGVTISVTISEGKKVNSLLASVANDTVGTLVGYGKGFSAESGATKITAARTTAIKMAPRVSIVRMSQKEYRFIAESPLPPALLPQYLGFYLAPGFVFSRLFKGAPNAQ